MMRRFGLRDDQWERIKDLLPGREGSVGETAADNRLFVEVVLYRYRTGTPWRDLPERFNTEAHAILARQAAAGAGETDLKFALGRTISQLSATASYPANFTRRSRRFLPSISPLLEHQTGSGDGRRTPGQDRRRCSSKRLHPALMAGCGRSCFLNLRFQ